MKKVKLLRIILIAIAALITIVWLATLPVALLAIGFSGGELLSPVELYRDLVSGDLYWTTRIWAWFAIAWPFAAFLVIIRLRRNV